MFYSTIKKTLPITIPLAITSILISIILGVMGLGAITLVPIVIGGLSVLTIVLLQLEDFAPGETQSQVKDGMISIDCGGEAPPVWVSDCPSAIANNNINANNNIWREEWSREFPDHGEWSQEFHDQERTEDYLTPISPAAQPLPLRRARKISANRIKKAKL